MENPIAVRIVAFAALEEICGIGVASNYSGGTSKQDLRFTSGCWGDAGVIHSQSPGRGAAKSLTSRQREVVQLLAEGKSMKQAGDVLGVTPRTVAFHKYQVMEELSLKTTADLIQFAIKSKILVP